MPIRGPLATLLAVAAAGVAVVTTNVVLTADPSDVEQPAAALSANSTGYDAAGSSGPAAAAAPDAAAPEQTAAPVRYDGRTAGDEVTVQVTVENGQAKAYICNAEKGIETWVRGAVTDGRMRLSGDDGASVEATSDGTAVFGTASATGKSWPFAAAVSSDAAPAPAQDPPPAQDPAPAQEPAEQPQEDSGGSSDGGY